MKLIYYFFGKILKIKKLLFKKTHLEYAGPYKDWETAKYNSTGYDSDVVLKKIVNSVNEVLSGKKKYERDGTSFDNLPAHNTLIQTLQKLSIYDKTIVDFGGSLGSNYINYLNFFSKNVKKYLVVEQKNICDLGNKISESNNFSLEFLESIEEIDEKIDIIICSSSLQYIEKWKEVVQKIIDKSPEHILIDRHPLTNKETKIFVQLNTGYYDKPVTYPIHIINEEEFLIAFKNYQCVKKWNSDFDPDYFKGFHLKKIN